MVAQPDGPVRSGAVEVHPPAQPDDGGTKLSTLIFLSPLEKPPVFFSHSHASTARSRRTVGVGTGWRRGRFSPAGYVRLGSRYFLDQDGGNGLAIAQPAAALWRDRCRRLVEHVNPPPRYYRRAFGYMGRGVFHTLAGTTGIRDALRPMSQLTNRRRGPDGVLARPYSAAGRPRLTKPSGSLAVRSSFSSASVASRWRSHIWA